MINKDNAERYVYGESRIYYLGNERITYLLKLED